MVQWYNDLMFELVLSLSLNYILIIILDLFDIQHDKFKKRYYKSLPQYANEIKKIIFKV